MKLHDENTTWVVSQMNKQKHKKVTGWSCHEVGGCIQIKSSEVGRKAAKPRRLLRSALKGSEETFTEVHVDLNQDTQALLSNPSLRTGVYEQSQT